MIVAMILAGGVGSRVGADKPKQFIEICGKPILAYTIEIYEQNPSVDIIQIVCHKEWINYTKNIIQKFCFKKVKWIIEGGDTFQTSVLNGVDFLKNQINEEDMIMIHYGASPFTSQKILNEGMKVCLEKGMSVSCIPCVQLLGSNENYKESNNWIDRDKIVQLSCPQSFKFSYLVDIYERSKNLGLLEVTEPHTTSLMYALGEKIYQSYGDQTNIKITTKEDLKLFEGYILYEKSLK